MTCWCMPCQTKLIALLILIRCCLPFAAHLLDVDVAFGAGLEELDAKLICERLAAAERHRTLVLVHVALVAHQDLQAK